MPPRKTAAAKPEPAPAPEEVVPQPVTGKISVPDDNGDELVMTLHGERTTFKVKGGEVSFENATQRDQLLGVVPGATLIE